ncbi:uncharacterized protein IUM83_03667 [Phytophthora cinnamomi]|uniref:uncharacterized protein n=1 Tax=Phytophthora cinnamomi TaxID=4785 RepID=UPI00355A18BF|nr:hypothetical protein IUM83_03667 [Phytophthora cinnamomi]
MQTSWSASPSTRSRTASAEDGNEFFDAIECPQSRALQVGGKRRRLNDVGDDCDVSELVDSNEDCPRTPAPKPSAASASPASVLAVYVHNTQHFECTLCTYTAPSFALLSRHRDSRHRRTAFLDRFSAGCGCGKPFPT